MKKLSDITYSHIQNHPKSKMREYTKAEFPWEYREYTEYSKHAFPKAFDSEEHFTQKYKAAPLVHLTPHELKRASYTTAGSYLHNGSVKSKVEDAHNEFSHRRDLSRIHDELHKGKMAPPIFLKHSRGIHILGGNTRMAYGLAHNIMVPVKLIDISDRH